MGVGLNKLNVQKGLHRAKFPLAVFSNNNPVSETPEMGKKSLISLFALIAELFF